LSALLVGLSIYIRLKMHESPLFAKIKSEGKISKNPLKESFGKKENLRMVLLALFGATAGQGVVWYTGQFYALSFIQKTCSVEFVQSNTIIAIALIIATPFFIIFGKLSDRIGRKSIMMTGLLLAIVCYRPIYKTMYNLTDVNLKQELTEKTNRDVQEEIQAEGSTVITTTTQKQFDDGSVYKELRKETRLAGASASTSKPEIRKEMVLGNSAFYMMIFLISIQVLFVTMVYGPIAAFLVELFPTRIRYTSMSLPYHIGNGIFGGLTPFIATFLYEASKSEANPTGDPFAGLWYPIGIAALSLVIGTLYLSSKHRHVDH
jgi:MHS family proline/betaine transporter-like MFS transporter